MTQIEITNKFTGQVSFVEVSNENAFKALNHYRGSWNVSKARFV